MSNAIKAIVGAVAVIVGVYFGQSWLVRVGASLLLNSAASALGPKPPRAPPLAGIDINYSGTLEPRRIIYGKLKVGGMNCLKPITSGSNNDYFHQVLALNGEAITAIDDVYFNEIRIPTTYIGAVTGSTADGLISGIPTPPTGIVNGNGFNGKAWVRRYDGTQTSVDYILNTTFTVWDSAKVGYGIPYLAIQLQWDQNAFSGGFPQITALVRGKKVYDPRLDTTNGGSGSQRIATPSTWTYSTNPALCLRDYLTSALGLAEDQTRIDDVLVAAAANTCDQAVTVPIPVLVGLTNWTTGSAVVTGSNTAFLSVMTNGAYVKAPNGSMLQVTTVNSDVQFTLSANYGGTSASAQVTQFNNASNATTVTQPRYTCNTALDATAAFQDNIATLAGAMMGHCLYSGGKWRMYAGAWSGSAFALDETDLVGNLTIQSTTPRVDLFNAVRGNFVNPQQNYQPSEFPPIINPSYATQDGGENIYVETNFPCCSDIFEAQRNAIIMGRQSRNRRVVTAQYGMSAFGVKVYETGTVTIGEIGWTNQTVRCTSWKFMPQGVIELTLQEAYSADWTDPTAGTDYVIKGVNVAPTSGKYLPYPPTALTATPVSGGIQFQVTLPSQLPAGTMIELWQYTASTPFSSAALMALGTHTNFTLPADQTTRYYWARTRGPNGQVSTTFPATTGVAGVGLSASDWTPTTHGTASVVGSVISKSSSGASAWDSDAYPPQNYQNGVSVTWRVSQNNLYVMVGLSASPGSSVSYTSLNAAMYTDSSGIIEIYSSGSQLIANAGSYAAGDSFEIRYDSITLRWFHNGALIYALRAPGLTLTPKVCLYSPGVVVTDFAFGATTANNIVGGNYLSTIPWIVGSTGSQGNYIDQAAAPGAVAGSIVLGSGISTSPYGPYGISEPLWQGNAGSSAPGIDTGWYNSGDLQGIDPAKTYRAAVWIRFHGTASGLLYFGAGVSGETCTVGTQTTDSNPYFVNGAALTSPIADKWFLCIGYIHGSGYTGSNTGLSGVYDPDSGSQFYVGQDYNQKAGITSQLHRAFLYSATGTTALTWWQTKPRFEEVNGAEPSIATLLSPAGALAYLDLADTDNLAANAATVVGQRFTAGPVNVSGTGGIQSASVDSFTVPTQTVNCTLQVTVTFQEYETSVAGTQVSTVDNGVTSSNAIPLTGASSANPSTDPITYQFAYTANTSTTLRLNWSVNSPGGPNSATYKNVQWRWEFIKR